MKGNRIMKNRSKILMVILPVVACFAFLPGAQAVCEDGCNNGLFNVWQGDDALINNTTGTGNSAFGWRALFTNPFGNFNTAVGAGALSVNDADSNTAVGAAALLLNNTGTQNTAIGTDALVFNAGGSFDDAVGAFALFNNIDGSGNNAFGHGALSSNLHAGSNTAVGDLALNFNDSTGNGLAGGNTAVGASALFFNTDGAFNTALGFQALFNNNGTNNTAFGSSAMAENLQGSGNVGIGFATLSNANSNNNTAVGVNAGQNINISGFDENIYIGDTAGTLDNAGNNPGNEAGVIRIGSFFSGTTACFINGIVSNGPFADAVTIDPATGQLGGLPSSARFKKDIEPMDKTSEAIYSLKPVTFHYKKDKTNTPWFGLIAEDVAEVNAALIGFDKEGKPYCVAYDKVNAMLLNEFHKDHRTVQELKTTVLQQQKQIEALTTAVQKVSAQLEVNRSAPQTVLNNQ